MCLGLDLIPEVSCHVHVNIPKSKTKSGIPNTSVPEHRREEISDCMLTGQLSLGEEFEGGQPEEHGEHQGQRAKSKGQTNPGSDNFSWTQCAHGLNQVLSAFSRC